MHPIIEMLKNEFLKRKSRNSRYSLRQYATLVGIHAATLSHLFNGKRQLTQNLLLQVQSFFELSEEEILAIQQKEDKLSRLFFEKRMLNQSFEWHHDAILELLRAKKKSLNIEDISSTLHLPKKEVVMAIASLKELKLVSSKKNGDIVILKHNLPLNQQLPTSISPSNQDILKRVMTIPRHKRKQFAMAFSLSKKDIPWVTSEIKTFQEHLLRNLEGKRERTEEVYELIINVLPLMKP